MTLSERRRELGKSLREVARAVNLGTAVLSRIERGAHLPPDAVLEDIGRELGWTIQQVKCALPTKEEVDRNFQRFSDAILAMGACHEDAKARGLGKGHGGAGEIQCPVCKSRLRYSVASVNGHMWGACATDGCVRWMQ